MKLILESWRQYITEMSRYEKETGKKSFAADEIKQYVSDEEFPTHAFTMTVKEKVGINPSTDFPTPAGVYFYPLNTKYYDKLVEGSLDEVTNLRPYVGVVELIDLDTNKWLKFINKGESYQTEEKVVEVLESVGQSLWDLNRSRLDNPRLFNADWLIYKVLAAAGKYVKDPESPYGRRVMTTRESTIKSNKDLKAHGYIGVYDAGHSVINPMQPAQMVALTPEAYDVVGFYTTKDVMRAKYDEPEEESEDETNS